MNRIIHAIVGLSTSPKAMLCSGMGSYQCSWQTHLHFCDYSINAGKLIKAVELHVLPSRPHLFQGLQCIFNKTLQGHILHTLQRQGFGRRGYRYWTDVPAALSHPHYRMFGES